MHVGVQRRVHSRPIVCSAFTAACTLTHGSCISVVSLSNSPILLPPGMLQSGIHMSSSVASGFLFFGLGIIKLRARTALARGDDGIKLHAKQCLSLLQTGGGVR